jgi:hypothetical protein
MAAKDFCEICLEETPIPEDAVKTATPYRLANEEVYLPARAARLSPGVQHLDRADELRNITGAVPRLIEGYEVGGSISERCYLKDLTWLLAIAGFDYVHTAGDGLITDPDGDAIPVGTHRWVYSKRDAITARTAQMRLNYATEDILLTGNGIGVPQLQLTAAGELSADLVGMVLARAAADTTTVPAVAASTIPPIRRGDLFLSWLSGGGKVADFSVQVANALERINSLSKDPPSYFPDDLELGNDQVQVTGSVPKRVLDGTDYDALLAATSFAAVARWVTPKVIGATAYKYSLWVEMPSCQLVSGDADELGNKRRHGANYDFFAAYDEALGYDVKITVVNDVAAIDTWGS